MTGPDELTKLRVSDADRQAIKEARSGKWPNKALLKARLLSDGGARPLTEHYTEHGWPE